MKLKATEFADGSATVDVVYNGKEWLHDGDFDTYAEARRHVMRQIHQDTIVKEEIISAD